MTRLNLVPTGTPCVVLATVESPSMPGGARALQEIGFVQGEDTPEFDQLATDLSAQKSKPESDHYLLAALWLSHSLSVE